MKRRDFLKNTLAAAAASHLPVALATELAQSTLPPQHDWRLGWQSVAQTDYAPMSMQVEGRIPAAVRGALFRNGPAKTERAGIRYRHWFDGDGMIQKFTLNERSISHSASFIRTEKFEEEEAAGRFLYSAAGTVIEDGKGSRNNDTANVANTSLLPWRDELLALWEGGSAYRVAPDSLETIGRQDWREDLQHMPFSAHPLIDRDGTLWNIGSAPWVNDSGAVFVYEIAPNGRVRNAKAISTVKPSYTHSFLMSERWLVIYLGAHVFEPGSETFVDAFQWQADLGSRVLLIDKDDLSNQKIIEVPAGFVFHGAHAYDDGDDIVANVSLYADSGIMHSGMIDLMNAGAADTPQYPEFSRAYLASIRIQPKANAARIETTDTLIEFPGIDSRFADQPTRIFGVGHGDQNNATVSDAIISVEPLTGKVDRFVFPEHHIVEEPLFVADTSRGSDGGWLVGTYLDYGRARSGVYVLDAKRVADGPQVLASMSRTLPLGFHGCFIGA